MDCHYGQEIGSVKTQLELLGQFDADYSPLVRIGYRIGPQALTVVLEELQGQKPHIPSPDHFWDRLAREVRNEQMRAEFNGRNLAELAARYQLAERYVRRIVCGQDGK